MKKNKEGDFNLKSEYKVGDRVRVINPKACYASYDSWFDKNAPEYQKYWRKRYSPKEIYQEHEEKNVFTIVYAGKNDSENPSRNIYMFLIQAYNGFVYLVNERAIEKIKYTIAPGDIVIVNNVQSAYTDYLFWFENIKSVFTEPYFQSLKNKYVENKLPKIGHRYKVIFSAPKAAMPPFLNDELYLLQDIDTDEVFIVGPEFLFVVK